MRTLTNIIVVPAALAILGLGCRATGSEAERGVVVTCGERLEIDAAKASRKDWNGETRGWTAEAKGDTLRVVRKGRCGDECNFVDEIVLAGIAEKCPRWVRASTTRRDAGSPVKNAGTVVEARSGTLQIQDWHPAGGIVSGRLTAEFSVTFYAAIEKESR